MHLSLLTRGCRLATVDAAMLEGKELVLSGWADTPAVRSVTGVLRLKGLEFRFEPFTLRELRQVLRHGRGVRGPVLRLDGREVAGTRAIRDFLEDHRPQPALRPRDISAAAWCHVLEDWAEEALAWRVAALRWLVPAHRERAALAAAAAMPALLRPVLAEAHVAVMTVRLRARGMTTADVPAAEAALRRDLDELDRLLHDRDALLGEPHGQCTADLVVAAELQALDGTSYEESVRARRSLIRWLRATRTIWEAAP
jgi:glutathione S-transferase